VFGVQLHLQVGVIDARHLLEFVGNLKASDNHRVELEELEERVAEEDGFIAGNQLSVFLAELGAQKVVRRDHAAQRLAIQEDGGSLLLVRVVLSQHKLLKLERVFTKCLYVLYVSVLALTPPVTPVVKAEAVEPKRAKFLAHMGLSSSVVCESWVVEENPLHFSLADFVVGWEAIGLENQLLVGKLVPHHHVEQVGLRVAYLMRIDHLGVGAGFHLSLDSLDEGVIELAQFLRPEALVAGH